MSTRKLTIGSTLAAAALIGATLSIAPISSASAQAGWRHNYYAHPYARSYYSPYRHRGYGAYAAYGSYGGYGGYGAYGSPSPYAYVNPNVTQYVNAGVVSYPIYRVDHYKVDYANPYYVNNGGCGACGGW
jgi:hypothetical protein